MKKICPKCGEQWEGTHFESDSNHFCKEKEIPYKDWESLGSKIGNIAKQEHWRVLLADTQCPYRLMADEKLQSSDIYFCSKRIDPEDNPYCSYVNCRIKEV